MSLSYRETHFYSFYCNRFWLFPGPDTWSTLDQSHILSWGIELGGKGRRRVDICHLRRSPSSCCCWNAWNSPVSETPSSATSFSCVNSVSYLRIIPINYTHRLPPFFPSILSPCLKQSELVSLMQQNLGWCRNWFQKLVVDSSPSGYVELAMGLNGMYKYTEKEQLLCYLLCSPEMPTSPMSVQCWGPAALPSNTEGMRHGDDGPLWDHMIN